MIAAQPVSEKAKSAARASGLRLFCSRLANILMGIDSSETACRMSIPVGIVCAGGVMIQQARHLGGAVSDSRSAPVTHQDQGLWSIGGSAGPLTHKASQKRFGHASACPIGRCTESVAHRPRAGVQPLVAHALAA